MEDILKFINEEIKDFEKDKETVPEKYRDVKTTIENQELRIDATLATLRSIKSYIEERLNNKEDKINS